MSRAKGITLYELVLFPILGVLMFVSKLFMEFLPNIHLLGMFIMVFTLVFRWKALIPYTFTLCWSASIWAFRLGGCLTCIRGRYCGR